MVEKEIEMMLKEEVIEAANSEWASPIVIVKKRDDTIRLYVDYHKLNAMTLVDANPMPRIDDILDQVGDTSPLLIWLKVTGKSQLQKRTGQKQHSSPHEVCINSK